MTTSIDSPRRSLAFTAVTVALGGYLLLMSLKSQLPVALSGVQSFPEEITAFLVIQLVIALAAFTIGFLAAPTSLGRRLIATGIGIALVVICLAVIALRFTREFASAVGGGGLWIGNSVGNAWFMVALAVLVGWLLVGRSNGFAFLLLLPTVVLIPVPFWMTLGGLSSGIQQITMLLLTIFVVAAVMGLSRLFVPRFVDYGQDLATV